MKSIEMISTIDDEFEELRARLYGFCNAAKVDRGGIAANITHEVRKHVQFHARMP